MEQRVIELLLTLNRITAKLKSLCEELDKLNSDFIDQEFEKIFVAEDLNIIAPQDYE